MSLYDMIFSRRDGGDPTKVNVPVEARTYGNPGFRDRGVPVSSKYSVSFKRSGQGRKEIHFCLTTSSKACGLGWKLAAKGFLKTKKISYFANFLLKFFHFCSPICFC